MNGKKIVVFISVLIFSLSSWASPTKSAHFDRAIFVMFENTNFDAAIKQPFLKELADRGALLSQLSALTHPSQGNYIALTSGNLAGVKNDKPVDLDVQNIVDLLEAKGLTWKVYAEDFPGNCFLGSQAKDYVRKHVPFISYTNIHNDPARCANIVEAGEFAKDAARGKLPNYIFYVPNLKNDGHNTGVAYADSWYERTFRKYTDDAKFMQNTLLISTFDEDGGSKQNHIYTSLFGPMVRPGTYNDSLTVYSLLKMIEDNWNLGNLGLEDVSAPATPDLWQ